MSYAVVWNSNDGPDCIGELELLPRLVQLRGVSDGSSETEVDVSFGDLDSIYLERCSPSKHSREPVLVLAVRNGDRIAVGSLEGLGALHELAESVEQGRQRVAV